MTNETVFIVSSVVFDKLLAGGWIDSDGRMTEKILVATPVRVDRIIRAIPIKKNIERGDSQ